MFFVPSQAKASFFSSIFGIDASANVDTQDAPTPEQLDKNSQNMNLLQANSSPLSVVQDKDSKKDKIKEGEVQEDVNVSIVSDSALLPATSLKGSTSNEVISEDSSFEDQISVYVVRKNDSISQIAEMFDVSVDTIRFANDLKKGQKLTEGDVLIILPISGLKHIVLKGQTLKGIAKLYKVDVSDIAGYNGIAEDASLSVGDELIIPDGVKAEENDKPIQNIKASVAKDKKYYESHPTKNISGYFINPVPGARLSQGLHDRYAVDLAISKGTPIHAAATGVVKFARMGYNGGFGGLVIITHPNGINTYYAHQSKIITHVGDQVNQGEIIGYVGSTGHSTGPHLHFEVRGAQNPGIDGSWK